VPDLAGCASAEIRDAGGETVETPGLEDGCSVVPGTDEVVLSWVRRVAAAAMGELVDTARDALDRVAADGAAVLLDGLAPVASTLSARGAAAVQPEIRQPPTMKIVAASHTARMLKPPE